MQNKISNQTNKYVTQSQTTKHTGQPTGETYVLLSRSEAGYSPTSRAFRANYGPVALTANDHQSWRPTPGESVSVLSRPQSP